MSRGVVSMGSRPARPVTGVTSVRASTIRDRLVSAADDEFTEYGTLTGRFEAIAQRAGMSRATAYRHIGSVSELLVQIGLRRSQRHVAQVREVMAAESGGVLAKIEAAMIYSTRELPNEPVVLALISGESSSDEPEVHRLTAEVMEPALVQGQYAGEIRTDVDLGCVMDFLTEQSYLAARSQDRSEAAVRWRFRTFIEPAIRPRPSEVDASIWGGPAAH